MTDGGAGPDKRKSHAPEGRLDLRDVKRLVNIMDRHGLAEVELEDEGRRLRLRKGGAEGHAHPVLAAVPVHPGGAAPAPAPAAGAAAAAPAPAAGGAAGAPRGIEIRSPMVGTFYRSPSPEAAPFIEVGDPVRKDMVVCIIEAMKVMNEIKSEAEGEVLAVLVQNGEAVEFDQPLFLLKPPGAA
jgi:acetyl-CoA carboxylase biotin carboxyl carrier protein